MARTRTAARTERASHPTSRPFVLTVDVEPDDREVDPWHPAEWQGFLDCRDWLEALRHRLVQRTGRPVVFSWFLRMDPQISTVYGTAEWVAHRHGGLLRALAAQGDVLGLHVHAFRWDSEAQRWVSDFADPRWVERCIADSVVAFVAAFGVPPRAFRFGDRWMSNRVAAQLARLGVRHDLTVEPGTKAIPGMVPAERSTGGLPDYRQTPRYPYRPSAADFRLPGRWSFRRRLWMLPVSTGCVNGPALPAPIEPQHDIVHLNLGLRPEWIRHLLDGLLDSESIVVSVARTGDARVAEGRANLLENLERLATHPGIAGRVFATPAAAISDYRRRARTRDDQDGFEGRRRALAPHTAGRS